MALESQYLDLLSNVEAQILALNLEYNNKAVPVEIKKISRWLPGINLGVLPIIFVVGEDKPESVVPWQSDDTVLVKYNCDVVLIAAGNQDNTANLDVFMFWKQTQRRLFQWGMQAQIQNCFFSEFVGQPTITREAFLKNYDVSGFGFRFHVIEPRFDQPAG